MRERSFLICADIEREVKTDMKKVTSIFRKIAGAVVITIGLAGLILPIIPGVPLILLGVALIGTDSPLVRKGIRLVKRYKRRITRKWRQRKLRSGGESGLSPML